MYKTTNKTAAAKVAAAVTTNTNTPKANTPAKCSKTPEAPAQLTEAEISQILAEYSPRSMSALRKSEAEITAKYGRSNWISIRARYQSDTKAGINEAQDGAIVAVRSYAPALADAYARICKNPEFVALAEYINITPEELAKNWPTGRAFVAATYPNTIGGDPAALVSYVRTDKAGDPSYIVDAYQSRDLSASVVPGILAACIRNIGKAAREYIGKITEIAPRIKTTAREPGKIVAAWHIAKGEAGTLAKNREADPVGAGVLAAIVTKGIAGFDTLAEYNAKAREAARKK